ncbi:cell division protein FtsX [Poseidonibacter sp.]|uniref:cell division protein FtsX n=1 Tax=Poseidonibacter sp. TaxID=2321188 RepID=UPI00359E94E5
MKSLKNLFAFLIPLIAMLLTFSIYLLIGNIVDNYKKKISNDYSIVIITNTPLIKENIDKLAGIQVSKIETLKKDKIIKEIKSDLSKKSIELLRRKLPYFYQIYLEVFPTTSELKEIKSTLLQNKNIRKVEIFYKNHNQVYLLLVLLNTISFILFFIITIFAIIIIAKQIKLWFHEHHTRISILRLHGASVLYSSSSVLKYAIFSAFLACIIVGSILFYVSNNLGMLFPIELHDIVNIEIDLKLEIMKIILLSFGISIFTIIGVLFKYKINND